MDSPSFSRSASAPSILPSTAEKTPTTHVGSSSHQSTLLPSDQPVLTRAPPPIRESPNRLRVGKEHLNLLDLSEIKKGDVLLRVCRDLDNSGDFPATRKDRLIMNGQSIARAPHKSHKDPFIMAPQKPCMRLFAPNQLTKT